MRKKVIEWALRAGVRAVKTAAQSAIGIIGASVAMGEVDWPLVAVCGVKPYGSIEM